MRKPVLLPILSRYRWKSKVLVTAHDIAPKWHIAMQAAFQEFTDNAVSKQSTSQRCHSDRSKKSIVWHINWDARESLCTGAAREAEVLTVGSDKSASDTPRTSPGGARPRKRPAITRGQTERVKTGCGTLYVTVNEDDEGVCEVFTTIGKAGGCSAAFSEATARMISLALRSGVELEQIVRQLRGIRCPHPVWQNGKLILSCPDAIAMVLQRYLDEKNGKEQSRGDVSLAGSKADACPECGGQLKHESGCETCMDCEIQPLQLITAARTQDKPTCLEWACLCSS